MFFQLFNIEEVRAVFAKEVFDISKALVSSKVSSETSAMWLLLEAHETVCVCVCVHVHRVRGPLGGLET